MEDEQLFALGGILHEARMDECYGNMQISSRKAWPLTFKEFRAQRQAGQPWIDVAIAQARAVAKWLSDNPSSSSGRTSDFESENRGSSPREGTSSHK